MTILTILTGLQFSTLVAWHDNRDDAIKDYRVQQFRGLGRVLRLRGVGGVVREVRNRRRFYQELVSGVCLLHPNSEGECPPVFPALLEGGVEGGDSVGREPGDEVADCECCCCCGVHS